MDNNMNNIYKLNTMEVVKEGLYLYRNNYKLLLKISLLSFLISMINSVLSYVRTISGTSSTFLLITLITLAISLPIIYFQLKLTVTMYICISGCYGGKLITVREAFKKSKESIWSYIGTIFLIILIVLPLVLIGYGAFLSVETKLLKYLMLLMIAIPFIYLVIIYGFAPLASVFEKGKASYFKLSQTLVKNNFWRIALLVISIGIITNVSVFFITNQNPWFKSLSALNQSIIRSSHDLLFVFISPAITCIIVVLYLTLRKNVVYKQD